MRRRWPLVAALLLVLVLVGWHPARVAIQTLLLLPGVFPNAPVDPLRLVAPAPRRTEHTLGYPAGTIEADVFHPAVGNRHGAVVLSVGAGELPRIDLAIRFAQALARTGVVVLLPQSSGLLAERLSPDEVEGLRLSYELLLQQPDVDPSRTGFIGLSAAGGLSLVAAAQPDLRERVRLVTSLGGYFDASSLLLDAASRSIDVDGQVRSWYPEQRTLDVIQHSLPDVDLTQLLAGTSRKQARAAIDALPDDVRRRLDGISPSHFLPEVRAHLYLLHDTDDTFIPFTETRALVRAAPAGLVERATEFSIFSHVVPDRPVPWQSLLPELWTLFWDIHAVLLELV